jgi:hypothetical protein
VYCFRFNGSTFDGVFRAADRAGFAAFFFAGFADFFATLDLATIFADFLLDCPFFFAAFAIIEAPFTHWLRPIGLAFAAAHLARVLRRTLSHRHAVAHLDSLA